MGPDRDLLRNLRIASPCSASWEEMRGDDRARYCEHCRLNVYNLSAMSAHEAAELVRETEGRLCVRWYWRADGTVLTTDCPVGFHAARRLLLSRLATLAAAFAGLFGFRPRLPTRQAYSQTATSEMPSSHAVMASPPGVLRQPLMGRRGFPIEGNTPFKKTFGRSAHAHRRRRWRRREHHPGR
jgi:hypothetical protein